MRPRPRGARTGPVCAADRLPTPGRPRTAAGGNPLFRGRLYHSRLVPSVPLTLAAVIAPPVLQLRPIESQRVPSRLVALPHPRRDANEILGVNGDDAAAVSPGTKNRAHLGF